MSPPTKSQKLDNSETDIKLILAENNRALQEKQDQFLKNLNVNFGAIAKGLENKLKEANDSISSNTTKIVSNVARIQELEQHASTSKDTHSLFEERLARLEDKADKSERNVRRNDIIISNLLAENSTQDWYDIIARIGNHLKVTICSSDISFLKVLNNENRQKNIRETNPGAPPGWDYIDLLVKFNSTYTKSQLFKAYMAGKNLNNRDLGLSLINARVYINDNLTIPNFNIYKKANSLFKVKNDDSGKVKRLVKSVYIYKGQVYVKPYEAATGILITSTDSLTALHSDIIKKDQ